MDYKLILSLILTLFVVFCGLTLTGYYCYNIGRKIGFYEGSAITRFPDKTPKRYQDLDPVTPSSKE